MSLSEQFDSATKMVTLLAEEQMFRRTLRKGLELFQKAAERHTGKTVFSGDDAFQLVTTHGFPKETIAELLESRGLVIDEARYQVLWEEFQKISNANKSVEVFSTSAICVLSCSKAFGS